MSPWGIILCLCVVARSTTTAAVYSLLSVFTVLLLDLAKQTPESQSIIYGGGESLQPKTLRFLLLLHYIAHPFFFLFILPFNIPAQSLVCVYCKKTERNRDWDLY